MRNQPRKELELELADRGSSSCKALGWMNSDLVGLSFQCDRSLPWQEHRDTENDIRVDRGSSGAF